MRLPWLAHDEAPGPNITIPQYRFNKTKQQTLAQKKRAKNEGRGLQMAWDAMHRGEASDVEKA